MDDANGVMIFTEPLSTPSCALVLLPLASSAWLRIMPPCQAASTATTSARHLPSWTDLWGWLLRDKVGLDTPPPPAACQVVIPCC